MTSRSLAVSFIDLPKYRNRAYYWFSMVAIIALLPFGVNNFVQGRPFMGWVVILVTTFFVGNVILIRRRGVEGIYPIFAALPISMALLAGMYQMGSVVVFWCYPAVVMLSFILSPRQTIVVVSLLLLLITPFIFEALPLIQATRAFITLALTGTLGAIFARTIETQHRELATLIVTDPLTGAYNRFRLDEELESALERHKRYQTPVALVAFDLDHFKKVNDELGHLIGDDALREVAAIITRRLRPYDRLFRIGGEEFLVILPETGQEMAGRVAEDIRRLVGISSLLPNRRITLSAGVTEVRPDDTNDTALVRADDALYEAKRQGRDRIVIAPFPPLADPTDDATVAS